MSEPGSFKTIMVKPLKKPLTRAAGIDAYYLHEMYLASLKASDIDQFEDLAKLVVELAIKRLDFDRIGVLLYDAEEQQICGTWGVDRHGQLADEREMRIPCQEKLHPIIHAVQDPGQIVLWEDTTILDFAGPGQPGVVAVGRGWNAAYAFWWHGELVGWIAADNLLTKQPFSPIHQQLFRMLGEMLGEFYRQIQNNQKINDLNSALARLNEKLEQKALHDHLTGLPNRRYFYDYFTRQKALCARDESVFALVLVDLDHFKQLNDRHGHHKGDQGLQQLAAIFHQHVRDADFVARLGGEEFVLMVYVDDLAQLESFCQRLKQQIEDDLAKNIGLSEPITASLGGFLPSQTIGTIDDMLRQADLNLYQAKASGRNTVVLSSAAQ